MIFSLVVVARRTRGRRFMPPEQYSGGPAERGREYSANSGVYAYLGGVMNRAIGLPLAAVVVLGLNACASSGIEDTQFRRRSTSLTTLKSDSAQCWKLAQKKNVSAADATGGVVMGTILFGVIGAAATAYAVEQDKQDPKNSVRRAAHDECMTQRGYKKVE